LAPEEEGEKTEIEVMPTSAAIRNAFARGLPDEPPMTGKAKVSFAPRKRGRPSIGAPWVDVGLSRTAWYRQRAKAKDGAKP
jgi:hypothetical protein